MEPNDVVDLLFQALVYAKDARIADVTCGDDGILLTTVHQGQTQAWAIARAALVETVPADDPS